MEEEWESSWTEWSSLSELTRWATIDEVKNQNNNVEYDDEWNPIGPVNLKPWSLGPSLPVPKKLKALRRRMPNYSSRAENFYGPSTSSQASSQIPPLASIFIKEKEPIRVQHVDINNPKMKCFLILKKHHMVFLNAHGIPGTFDPRRKRLSEHRIEGTEIGRSHHTKITVYGKDDEELNKALDALYQQKKEYEHKISRGLKGRINIFWKEIPVNHCMICFQEGHQRTTSKNCG